MREVRPALAILLALCAVQAQAAPLSGEDVAKLRVAFHWDDVAGRVAAYSVSTMDVDWTKTDKACVTERVVKMYEITVDKSIRALVSDHESAIAWLDFAASRGGSALLRVMADTVTAKVEGREVPDPVQAVEDMDEAAREEVRQFKATPAGAKGPPKLLHIATEDSEQLARSVDKDCVIPAQAKTGT